MKKIIQKLVMIIIILILGACLNKNAIEKGVENVVEKNNELEKVLLIKEIGEGYIITENTYPSDYSYKIIVPQKDELCVNDYVKVSIKEMVEVSNNTFEITPNSVELTKFDLQETVVYKPIIYLYPTEIERVKVTINYNGTLTHTYPIYANGWEVVAYPDGNLIDKNGMEYPYLFWEGISDMEYDMSKGFCVLGNETEEFLRNKLSFMGLNQKELEEFIEFWVPFMEKNPYNKISFQMENYTENAKLTVYPEPDSMLRIFMVFRPLDEFAKVEEQVLTKFERTGFALIEWGGAIIK